MTVIMPWDRQNYFQTYEFELISQWGFRLILTTEQGGEDFLKALLGTVFLLNALYLFLSVVGASYSYQL